MTTTIVLISDAGSRIAGGIIAAALPGAQLDGFTASLSLGRRSAA